MSDPTHNKPAAVQLYALTSAGVRVPLRADASGNLTLGADVDIDTSLLATAAHQVTQNGYLDGLETLITATNAAVLAMQNALNAPTTYTTITPSDSTNVTSTCTKGIFVAVTGNVNITGVGGSAVSLGTQIAGTTIPGALSRVNAATTATVFGLSGP